MYQGSIAPVSNREDWIFQSALIDDDGTAVDLTSATIKIWVTAKDNSSSSLLSAQTGDGKITLPTSTSFQWQFTPTQVGVLNPGVYNVFARITIAGVTTQLLSCTVTVVDGGPA